MAKRWIVLTAERAPLMVNAIIGLTEWDGYVGAADEVIYTDPVDTGGVRVDELWKVGGSVTLAGGVYTYTDPTTEPSLADRQRAQIQSAYLWWRLFGRTSHWAGLRATADKFDPLDATDKWAYSIVALMDAVINGNFVASRTAEQKQELIDHADIILRTLGPTWYGVMVGNLMRRDQWRAASLVDPAEIYTDICDRDGTPRAVDGSFVTMIVRFRTGFDPESPTLGN